MKLRLGLLIFALFFSINIIFGISSSEYPDSNIFPSSDSITGKVTSAVLKINPFQTLLCEIPVSIELFQPQQRSIQLQVGYIFPLEGNSGLFESNGTNGDASNKGILSYRNSPFNNHGISVKFEFRKYRNNIYHGAQFMFKHSYYKNAVFPLFSSGFTYDQKENKSSIILGFGYVIGQQSDDNNFIFDWYMALGFRIRVMEVKILERENPVGRFMDYPDTSDTFSSFYPFLNLGVRIGFRLQKRVWV